MTRTADIGGKGMLGTAQTGATQTADTERMADIEQATGATQIGATQTADTERMANIEQVNGTAQIGMAQSDMAQTDMAQSGATQTADTERMADIEQVNGTAQTGAAQTADTERMADIKQVNGTEQTGATNRPANTRRLADMERSGGAAQVIGAATARSPGSCGELAQGMLNGGYFLVSCPIDMYAYAEVALTGGGGGNVDAPANASKARQAVGLTLAHFGRRDVDARLRLSSPLPRGKGMASSTADISAAIGATAAALGEYANLPPTDIAAIALRIEPSDGTMLPGIAMLDHKCGSIAKTLGTPPPMRVLMLDFGGKVDTLAFNGINRDDALRRLQPDFAAALALIERGIRNGSAADVGAGATRSAIANQSLLHKPQLPAVIALAEELGAVGVNAAHSGTALGMLFADDTLAASAAAQIRRRIPGVERVYNRRIIGGGVTITEMADKPATGASAGDTAAGELTGDTAADGALAGDTSAVGASAVDTSERLH